MNAGMKIKVTKIKLKASDEVFKYRLELNPLYNSNKYVINGEDVSIQNRTKITFDELPTITFVTYRNALISYKDEDGEIMTVDEYNFITGELKREGGYDEDDGCWSDIDKEYEYKKMTKCYSQVRETQESISEIEYEISELYIIDTEDEYIVSDYFMGTDSPMCILETGAFVKDMFRKSCISRDLKENEQGGFVIGSHTGIRFAQVNGKYIFSENDGVDGKRKLRNTFERLVDEKEKIAKMIDAKVDIQVRAMRNQLKLSAEDVINSLKSIQNGINGLDVKRVSDTAKTVLQKQIRNLMESL
jgi:hypothetical protein